MKRTRTLPLCLLFAILAPPGARAAPQLALGDGEELDYRVSWAVLLGVGEIKISGKAVTDPKGTPLLRVDTSTATRGIARLLLPFDARGESLFDIQTGRLLWLGESSSTRGKHDAHTINFDYANKTAIYVVASNPSNPRRIPLPEGFPNDLITCLVQARTWNPKPGESRETVVLFEDQFYPLTIHALRLERVGTPLGDFTAIVLEPRMDRTPPKGMFKRGSTVRVWIAEDALRLPVRFRVEFPLGAGTATLVGYHPPASSAKPKAR